MKVDISSDCFIFSRVQVFLPPGIYNERRNLKKTLDEGGKGELDLENVCTPRVSEYDIVGFIQHKLCKAE